MTLGSTNLDVNWHLHVNCFASAPDVLYYLYQYPRIVRTQKVVEVGGGWLAKKISCVQSRYNRYWYVFGVVKPTTQTLPS